MHVNSQRTSTAKSLNTPRLTVVCVCVCLDEQQSRTHAMTLGGVPARSWGGTAQLPLAPLRPAPSAGTLPRAPGDGNAPMPLEAVPGQRWAAILAAATRASPPGGRAMSLSRGQRRAHQVTARRVADTPTGWADWDLADRCGAASFAHNAARWYRASSPTPPWQHPFEATGGGAVQWRSASQARPTG